MTDDDYSDQEKVEEVIVTSDYFKANICGKHTATVNSQSIIVQPGDRIIIERKGGKNMSKCEVCCGPIDEGKICESCKSDLTNESEVFK